MTERELERLLAETASGLRYPLTPDLTGRVLSAIAAPAGARRAGRKLAPSALALALALAVALAALLALAFSRAGDAVARFFGVEGSRIERLPPPPRGVTATLPQSPAGGPGGDVVTLTEAATRAGFAPSLPGGRGPSAVYLITYGGQPVIVLRYPEFDLWQARLQPSATFGKLVPPAGTVHDVTVRGNPATWVSGAPHSVVYLLPDGTALPESLRTVETSTLIWRTSAAFYRLETDLPFDAAIAVAESLP